MIKIGNPNKHKYTAVVPTMLKSPRFQKLVEDLQNEPFCDEVIIIDNSGNLEPSIPYHPKQRYICEGRNTGCNPAWNKGVELAKNKSVVICNDDINFDTKILGIINPIILQNSGIIGLGGESFTINESLDYPKIQRWQSGIDESGWGCLLFTLKSHWIQIPDDLIVWYGDNFIKDVNPIAKSILRGWKVETEMSTTTDLPELDEIKKQDLKNWLRHFQNRGRWRV